MWLLFPNADEIKAYFLVYRDGNKTQHGGFLALPDPNGARFSKIGVRKGFRIKTCAVRVYVNLTRLTGPEYNIFSFKYSSNII